MSNLAVVLKDQHRLKEAEELSREALNYWKANLLPNDSNIGISMKYLADIVNSQNRF